MLCLAVVLALLSSSRGSGDSPGLTLSCDARSAVRADTTREDLVRRFGAGNVHDEPVYVGEGMSEPGTVLFGEDEEKRIGIIWKNDARKDAPKSVRTSVILKQHSEKHSEEVTPDRSQWRGPAGIKLGTTLKELERINRRPFRLAGFGWDGSGTVVSWQKGRLESAPGCYLMLRLTPPENKMAETASVTGDRIFSSSHPAMQATNPRVYQLLLSFEQ